MSRFDEKPGPIYVALVILIVAFPLAGCSKSTPIDSAETYGELLGSHGCKLDEGNTLAAVSSNEECLEWDLQAGVLSLTHVNSAFNCCIDFVTAEVLIEGNSITVIEQERLEQGQGCLCRCLYDLDLVVYDPPAGQYFLSLSGPYSPSPLDLSIDLVGQPSGRYCVDRDPYPWGEGI
jgi:hypothetical protein